MGARFFCVDIDQPALMVSHLSTHSLLTDTRRTQLPVRRIVTRRATRRRPRIRPPNATRFLRSTDTVTAADAAAAAATRAATAAAAESTALPPPGSTPNPSIRLSIPPVSPLVFCLPSLCSAFIICNVSFRRIRFEQLQRSAGGIGRRGGSSSHSSALGQSGSGPPAAHAAATAPATVGQPPAAALAGPAASAAPVHAVPEAAAGQVGRPGP